MKIRPAGAELFDPNRRMDRQTRQSLESLFLTLRKILKIQLLVIFCIFRSQIIKFRFDPIFSFIPKAVLVKYLSLLFLRFIRVLCNALCNLCLYVVLFMLLAAWLLTQHVHKQ
jgi:hypothetical protein